MEKRCWGRSGDRRQKGRKAKRVNQGDLSGEESAFIEAENPYEELTPTGGRASIVARKRRNGRGAKGRRKVET